VMARVDGPVEWRASRVGDAIEDAAPRRNGAAISIARCCELLGDDGCALSDEEIDLVRRCADARAHILVEMFLQTSPSGG
jgi:hypothetical protein